MDHEDEELKQRMRNQVINQSIIITSKVQKKTIFMLFLMVLI